MSKGAYSNDDSLPVVPLLIDGVVIGKVFVDDDAKLNAVVTSKDTKSYLKELLMTDVVTSISLVVDYIEAPENHIAPVAERLLNLVREN